MTTDEVSELLRLLGSEIFGRGRVDALSEQSYRRWRSVWARPLAREQMHRACDGFQALLTRLMDFDLLDAGAALTQLCALARMLRLDGAELADGMSERARRAERSLGAPRRKIGGDKVEGRPAWMIRLRS